MTRIGILAITDNHAVIHAASVSLCGNNVLGSYTKCEPGIDDDARIKISKPKSLSFGPLGRVIGRNRDDLEKLTDGQLC